MSTPAFGLSLTVGATGMLAGALDFVAERSQRTLVVARHATRALAERPRPRAIALDLDWRRTRQCLAGIDLASRSTPVDLALLWIHGSGARVLETLLDRLKTTDYLIVHVLGSMTPHPHAFRDALDRAKARCRYRTVRLGEIPIEYGGTRWLTDEEISAGAIHAIRTGEDVTVGRVPT